MAIAVLRAEQALLFRQCLPLAILPLVTSTLMIISLLTVHEPIPILLWYVLYIPMPVTLLVLLVRKGNTVQNTAPSKPPTGKLSQSAETVSLISGIFWGIATPLFGHQDQNLLMFMTVMQISHACGFAQLLAPLPRLVFRFTSLALLPNTVMLLATGDLLPITIGVLCAAIYICILFSSFSNAQQLRTKALSETRARRAEALLRASINAMPDAFAVYNFQGEMILENTNHRNWNLNFQAPASDNGERVSQTKTGRWMRHNWTAVPETGTLTIHSDITDQKHREQLLIQAREQAQVATEAQSRFLSRISHELRTPLNSVLGFSELLAPVVRKKTSWGTVEEYVDYIHSSGKHLLSLVDDIIDYTNLGENTDRINVSVVNLNDLIVHAIKIGRTKAGVPSNHRVLIRLHKEIQFLRTDQKYLERIIANVISNSVKFSDNGSKIAISSSYSKTGTPVLTIRDFGHGMTQAQLKSAFSIFYQADETHGRHSEGTGMGLAVVKRLAALLDIDVKLASKVGHGTAVIMTFAASSAVAGPATTDLGDLKEQSV